MKVMFAVLMFAVQLLALSQGSWQKIYDLWDVRDVVSAPGGRVYVVTSGMILILPEKGETPDTLHFPDEQISDFFSFIVLPQTGSLIVATEPGVYRSEDEGSTWEKLDSALIGTYSMAIDSSGVVFASGSNGVYVSQNDGISWDSIGATQSTFTDGVLFHPSKKVFVASVGGGLAVYNLETATWDTVTGIQGLPAIANAMAVSPVTKTLLVGEANIHNTGSETKIFRSTDEGKSWQIVSDSNNFIDALYADNEGNFYAGAGGIMRSTDDGLTWEPFDTGLPPEAQIQSIERIGNTLFAGDRGNGLYRLDMVTAMEENNNENAKGFSLEQNYPNPFNPSTIIKYSLTTTEFVRLDIYDVSGRKIATLAEGMQDAGKKSVVWNAEGVAGGIYFYRLQAGTTTETRKLLLTK